MNDYMRALHQRFYREPDFSELEEDIENTRQEVRDCLDKLQRRRLMHLVDTQNLLREETSLASFTAGFKLAWGLSKELEADGLILRQAYQQMPPKVEYRLTEKGEELMKILDLLCVWGEQNRPKR